jgi:hypothetical protein
VAQDQLVTWAHEPPACAARAGRNEPKSLAGTRADSGARPVLVRRDAERHESAVLTNLTMARNPPGRPPLELQASSFARKSPGPLVAPATGGFSARATPNRLTPHRVVVTPTPILK